MASLVGAVYKGTVKSVQADVGSVYSKLSSQVPNPSRAIYNLGLGIGPLLESIVSELDKKPGGGQTRQSEDTSSSIAKATSEGFKALSFQISSLSNIMRDIRSIAMLQLNEQKASSFRARQMEVQKKFGEQESIIERASLSSLKPEDKTKGSALSSAVGDAWSTAMKLAGGLLLGAMFYDQLIKPMLTGIEEQLQKNGPAVAEQIGRSVKDFIWNLVPDFIRKPAEEAYGKVSEFVGPEGMSALKTGSIAALVSRVITSNPLLNAGAGIGAGLGRFFMGEDISLGESAAFGAAGMGAMGLGGYAGRKMMERRAENRAANKIADRVGDRIKESMSDEQFRRYQDSKGALPTGKIASTAEVPDLKPAQLSKINKPEIAANDSRSPSAYEKAKKYAGKLSALVEKHGPKKIFKLVVSRLGYKAAAAFMGSLVGGPIGILLFILSTGTLIYEIIDALSGDENDIKKQTASSIAEPTDTKGFIEPTPMAEAKPGLTDTVTAHTTSGNFDMERYKRIVMDRESKGDLSAQASTSSATGLYQFTRGTYEGIRRTDQRFKGKSFEDFAKDRDLQELAMDILTKRNFTTLRQFLGRDPTEEEMYLAHFLGAQGAIRLIKAAEEGKLVGESVNSRAITSNPNMFPSPNEKAADALSRITGYYSQGKMTKLGKVQTPPLQDLKDRIEGIFNGKDVVDKGSKEGTSLAAQVTSALAPFMQLMSGSLETVASAAGVPQSQGGGGTQPADPVHAPTFSNEKDRHNFFLNDQSYYGATARR